MIYEKDLDKEFYRPGEIANMMGLSLRTIQKYMDDGVLPCTVTGQRNRRVKKDDLVELLDRRGLVERLQDNRKDAVYVRVSTHKQREKGDLQRQEEKILAYASLHNPKNLKIFHDVSSGLNDKRKGLSHLLDDVMNDEIDRVFVLYKDRLTRFGFHYLKKICDKHGTTIVIISDEQSSKTLEEELAEDIISVIHSFSGKLYGMRKTVKDQVIKNLEERR